MLDFPLAHAAFCFKLKPANIPWSPSLALHKTKDLEAPLIYILSALIIKFQSHDKFSTDCMACSP